MLCSDRSKPSDQSYPDCRPFRRQPKPLRTPSVGSTRSCERGTSSSLNWIVRADVVQHPLIRSAASALSGRWILTPNDFGFTCPPQAGVTSPDGGSTEEDACLQLLQPKYHQRALTNCSTLGRKLSHPDRSTEDVKRANPFGSIGSSTLEARFRSSSPKWPCD